MFRRYFAPFFVARTFAIVVCTNIKYVQKSLSSPIFNTTLVNQADHINSLVVNHWTIYRFAKVRGGYALIYLLHAVSEGAITQYRVERVTGLKKAHVNRLVTRGIKAGYITSRPLQITSKGMQVLRQYYMLLTGDY